MNEAPRGRALCIAAPACVALALSALVGLGCGGRDAVEGVKRLPAERVSAELPTDPLAVWIAGVAHPTPTEWREVDCPVIRDGLRRSGEPCVEVSARHANGIHFAATFVAGEEPKVVSLTLEVGGSRREFERIDAWALAMASLAPRSRRGPPAHLPGRPA